jgi:hypothetical protein
MRRRQAKSKILLFLKKKKQKDFYPFGSAQGVCRSVRSLDRQEFFASFLQKRRLFLASS